MFTFHRSADRLTNDAFNIPEHAEGPVLRRASSDDTAASAGETSDDILAKYRKKPLAEDKVDGIADMEVEESRRAQEEQDVPLHEMDRDNLEVSFVFQDARRKLRLVLSEVELPVVQGGGEDREVVGLLEVEIFIFPQSAFLKAFFSGDVGTGAQPTGQKRGGTVERNTPMPLPLRPGWKLKVDLILNLSRRVA